jgi:hypothetical protein
LLVGAVSCGSDPINEPSNTGASTTAPPATSAGKAEVPDQSSTSASTTTVPTTSTSSTTSIPVVPASRAPSSNG